MGDLFSCNLAQVVVVQLLISVLLHALKGL